MNYFMRTIMTFVVVLLFTLVGCTGLEEQLLEKAEIAMEDGEYEIAIEYFEEALDQNDEHEQIYERIKEAKRKKLKIEIQEYIEKISEINAILKECIKNTTAEGASERKDFKENLSYYGKLIDDISRKVEFDVIEELEEVHKVHVDYVNQTNEAIRRYIEYHKGEADFLILAESAAYMMMAGESIQEFQHEINHILKEYDLEELLL